MVSPLCRTQVSRATGVSDFNVEGTAQSPPGVSRAVLGFILKRYFHDFPTALVVFDLILALLVIAITRVVLIQLFVGIFVLVQNIINTSWSFCCDVPLVHILAVTVRGTSGSVNLRSSRLRVLE
jgi:hypothetical protein